MLEEDAFEHPLVLVTGAEGIAAFDEDAVVVGNEVTCQDRVDEMLSPRNQFLITGIFV